MTKPNLPAAGDTIRVLGLSVEVTYVEPETDYRWRITGVTWNDNGNTEEVVISVPTDYRTDDGKHVNK